MFGWIFGSFGISKPCISTIYPLFSTTQRHGEYAAPTVRETVECPLALVVSGPTPSVTNLKQSNGTRISEPSVAETCLL